MNHDLAARKVIVASYMYYMFDAPPLSDGEYDALCKIVADNWDQLDPVRQWQLGSADEIRASGFGIKHTAYSVAAAYALYFETHGKPPSFPWPAPKRWKRDKVMKLRYVTSAA